MPSHMTFSNYPEEMTSLTAAQVRRAMAEAMECKPDFPIGARFKVGDIERAKQAILKAIRHPADAWKEAPPYSVVEYMGIAVELDRSVLPSEMMLVDDQNKVWARFLI